MTAVATTITTVTQFASNNFLIVIMMLMMLVMVMMMTFIEGSVVGWQLCRQMLFMPHQIVIGNYYECFLSSTIPSKEILFFFTFCSLFRGEMGVYFSNRNSRILWRKNHQKKPFNPIIPQIPRIDKFKGNKTKKHTHKRTHKLCENKMQASHR